MNFIPTDAIRHPPDGMQGGCSPSSQEETEAQRQLSHSRWGTRENYRMDGNVGNRAGKLTLQPLLSTYSYSPAAPGPGSEAVCVHLTAVMFPSKGCHSWGTQKSQGAAHNYPGTDW